MAWLPDEPLSNAGHDSTEEVHRQPGCLCRYWTFEAGPNHGVPQRQFNSACPVHGELHAITS
jgi:hypothetical protein